MSSISRWSYQNVMTVWPFEGTDPRTGDVSFGTPYTVACTYIGGGEIQRDDSGDEFVPSWTAWHEDGHDIKREDYILLGESSTEPDPIEAGAYRVRKITVYDMSPFADTPDYVAYTG